MSNAQEAITTIQNQALEAIKSGQAAAIEGVQAWSTAVAKLRPEGPGFNELPGAKDAVGDPSAIVDSVYDFAAQLMDLNKQFVHSLLAASQTVVETGTESK